LLSAILGDMQLRPGSGAVTRLSADIAYHSQQPWILNATVRDNILFGRDFDEALFAAAIEGSCLAADLAVLPAGVMTDIGEKGINLSG
jgi:ABC-type multidrug transport system fused ATPase/permease subunit